MGPTASRKNRQSALTVRTHRTGLIDSLEPRLLMAADADG
jgi:hypothetical protein